MFETLGAGRRATACAESQMGGGVVRNMVATPDGRLYLAMIEIVR
jgi:hypothetical protein